MSNRLWLLLLPVLLFTNTSHPAKADGNIVHFRTADIPPTSFQAKRAKAKGQVAPAIPGQDLLGYLYEPVKEGKHPALVLLVSSDGLQNSHRQWAQTISDNGFVVLLVDSYGSRGHIDYRGLGTLPWTDDGIAAGNYLSALKTVLPEKIGIMGFSAGAIAILALLDETREWKDAKINFKVGVTIYPLCNPDDKYISPILMVTGGADGFVGQKACRDYSANAKAANYDVTYILYPEAIHFFDNPNYSKDPKIRGKTGNLPLWFNAHDYNPEIHKDSITRVISFLTTMLAS
ncbi:MAG: dienelactone hydrolase family protein [Cohaesibacteraceae bacterium]|nr:dienelactone hydrolase family protein [Cohaesibacteraceae bacterium]MBL4874929.1 dienelactone hydrolase family protein [Cohaesibacteraceae bacterium]